MKENLKSWIALILNVVVMVIIWAIVIFVNTGYQFKETSDILLKIIMYHVIIRIAIGIITNHMPISAFHPNYIIYKEHNWEKKLYEKIRVKSWKNLMPVFDQSKWDIHVRTLDEIIGYGCQAELAHSCNVVFSLISIVFASLFGKSRMILLFTGCTASVFDLIFITIQRFNRPRLMRLQGYESIICNQ